MSGGSILIADEDTVTRESVSALLRRAGYEAREAATGEEALEVGRRERPVLALLDVGLPGISGYEVCHALKAEIGETMPVILMSGSRTKPYDHAIGLLIGADDYVTKPFDSVELLARMRRCIVRAALIVEGATGTARTNPFGLSPRELEILTLLGRGLGTDAIADRLVISKKTVCTHVQRILSKLGAHSRAEAIAIAFRARLIVGDEHGEDGVAGVA